MGIEWKSEEEKLANAAQDPSCNLLIFPRVTARDECINVLRMHSGSDALSRAPIEKDKGIRNEVLNQSPINDPTGASVLAVNVALARPSGFLTGSNTFEPKLFVLTRKHVVVFTINLLNWQPQRANRGEDFEIDDFRPQDLFPPPPAYAGATATAARQNAGNTAMLLPAAAASKPAPSKPVLTAESTSHDVSGIRSVTFETSAEADLSLVTGKGDLRIRFYDDSAREHWRRALAYILLRNPRKWKRSMDAGDSQ